MMNEGIRKVEKREVWPLTFSERQMAIEQAMDASSVAYNINLAYSIQGEIDQKKLQNAMNQLVKIHPILTSYYPLEQGEYVHRLATDLEIIIEEVQCEKEEVEAQVQQRNLPFFLETAPLMRCYIFRHGEEKDTLCFCIHHSIFDGGSTNIFLHDLFALYEGKEVELPELDYLDHAVWASQETESIASGERVFNEIFSNGAPENEMPTVPIRPEVLPFADEEIVRKISSSVVKETATKLGVTSFGLLASVLGMTLGKYCGSEDVVIGTAMGGRTRKEQAGMIGMFVNTLPIRLKPVGTDKVSDYVKETAQMIRTVKANQTYPFEQLVPVLAPDRNASRAPVFDVIINYLQAFQMPKVSEFVIEEYPMKRQSMAIDLMFEITHEGDNLRIQLEYSKDLYDTEVIENFMEQYFYTLEGIIKGSGLETIAEVTELPERQIAQIVEGFRGVQTDAFQGKTIVELLKESALKYPDNLAVVFKNEHLTYTELDDVTDRLAAVLVKQGICPGTVVGAMVHRSMMMPIASIAIMKAGAAYLPLDPSYPSDRLEFMLEDSAAAVVIADADLFDRIPNYHGVFLDTSEVFQMPPCDVELSGPTPDDIMVMLYTSGTTGKPKGVMILQRNMANFSHYYCRKYQLTDADRIPAYASFGFDANMMDTYPTLISGATLHIIPEEMRLDLDGIARYYEENEITVAFMTTQLGRQFAEAKETGKLRALSVGGEALTPLVPPNFELFNLYGPSECTIICSAFKVDKVYQRMPIGKPIDNTALYVLDDKGRLAPVGVAGELCIAGRQVGNGYLNRPDLTEEKFVKNPFLEEADYAVMYKSGDVVRYLPSGEIDFVGRRDFQVKIRGFRIELTEIEGRIRAFEGIKDAAILAQDDAGGGKRIVAYIVSEEGTIDISALEAFIEEELPAYMVPTATMQIDAIPLTPNGKVNARALPKIVIKAEEIVPPETALEQQLVDILLPILGLEEVGITTDLMYMGLNSLSAIKAASLVTEGTGKQLSTMVLMKEKTIQNIAKVLESSSDYEEKSYAKQETYPLTQNQLGLYFACVKEPESLVYNIPFAIELDGKTDGEKLKDSIQNVLEAHSYLYTYFMMKDNEPRQCRVEIGKVEIPIIMSTLEEVEQRKLKFVRPFHFFQGPLFRMEIHQTEVGVFLLCDFHHIVFDGGSMDIFLKDLVEAYAGNEVKAETFTSFELALQEAEVGTGEVYQQAKQFFHDRIGDCEGATDIPTDQDAVGEGMPKTVTAALPKGSVDSVIKGLAITPSNLFLAATGLVTGRFSSTNDVRITAISNGRDGANLQRNIGMLVKTLPVALQYQADLTAGQCLEYVQEEMLEILSHAGYSYLHASSEYNYHSQLLYAFQGGVVSQYEIEDSEVKVTPLGLNKVKFPISINIQEDEKQYYVEAEYDDAIFKEETMRTFAECIAHVAKTFTQQLEGKIGQMSIMTKEQRNVIQSFNPSIIPNKIEALHTLFEGCAQATPDAPALYAKELEFTYRELNEKANALAHSLLELGVEKEDRIAFLLPRDSRIIISMLGIMKAGCAYIPVDPDYPDDRIEHVISDSGARYIITDNRQLENSIDVNELMSHGNLENPNLDVKKKDLCYIIYTSGSTGKPKGVMLTHEGIINYVVDTPGNRHVQALKEHQCSMVSVTTVSFDMFLKEAFTTLMNGMKLILADDEQAKNPVKLAELFRKTGGNAFNATPSRMLQYMELPEIADALSKCKVIMAGGEGYPVALYTKLRKITDAILINTYGPTEITVSSNGKILEGETITIGAPLHNVVEQVMDIEGNPLPVGVIGELWIGGKGVSRGYYGNPEMTEERFVQHEHARFYKSGDLARWTNQGEIIILGRNDGQIKLRGLRIELGEIEKTIGEYEGIKSCVVLVKKIRGQEHLCAFYTADMAIAAEELRKELLKTLTVYMVPTAYLQLTAMPMTPNGKIDRKVLPEPQLMQMAEYVKPETPEEEAYCEIFAHTLQLEQVGATDNFFDLGGTSLLVTQITIDAAQKGYSVDYGDVFANPTPRELAALLDTEQVNKRETSDEAIVDYDYSHIHQMLKENTLESFREGERYELGNICITGATGFLGIHVLREFIRSEKGTAYCVIRGGRRTAEERLKGMLAYYFASDFEELFGSRIIVIDGDITSLDMFQELTKYPVDTYFNCAANVKHFSTGTDIEDVNVTGTQNGVDFCKTKKARFIQVSTASIAGMSINNQPEEQMKMDETMFYFGQDLSNKYTNSKFLAERYVLEAVTQGLEGKIMRVGNLMARDEDGEFQANFKTNNFLSHIRAYSIIGCVPYEDAGGSTELAPIDFTARAILRLATTPNKNVIFHPYNDHHIFMSDVLAALVQSGVALKPVEREEYDKAYKEAMLNRDKAKHLNSMIAYQEHGKRVVPIKTTNSYTSQTLFRLGFKWPITSTEYLKNFFANMIGLGFFDQDDQE